MSRSDNFNRANAEPLGTPSDGGSDWIESPGSMSIATNKARNLSSAAGQISVLETGSADGAVQVTVGTPSSGGGDSTGVVVRYVDNNNYLLFLVSDTGATLYRVQTSDYTSIGSSPASVAADGMVLAVTMSGSDIACKFNGATVIEATSSFQATVTKHGIRSDHDSAAQFDDFSFTSAGGGGPTTATVSGPSTGAISEESAAFTVTLDSASVGTTTVDLASSDGGDVFHATSGGSTVASIDIADGETVGTFYLLPDATVGARTITPTADGIAFTPTTLTYTTTAPALTAGTASFVSSGPDGIAMEATDATGGTEPITQQWQRNEDGGDYADLTDGGGVTGATTLELIDGSTEAGTLYGYRLVYTDDDSETATSNVVTAQVYTGGPLTGGGNTYSRGRIVNG